MSGISVGPSYDVDELDRRERKRLQNRMAQRIYRRNQKQRLQALEAAVANTAAVNRLTPPESVFQDSRDDLHASHITEQPRRPCEDRDSAEDTSAWIEILDGPFNEPMTASSSPPLRTALHRAVCNGNDSMIRILLDNGADITKVDENGNSILHLAAECANEETISILLSKGGDPNGKNYLGRTALFSAAQVGNDAAAKALLAQSSPIIDINWRDSAGMVALHLAVDNGFESMTRLLLANGANVNA
ncbi:ankyrin repeat-containing domain protein [Truncatella angustata]|uniref:Ankyrin repeat-containing domain protein n=1 Tax=Truncatella angustata TaxID=152316 RepID=A0A9P8UW23_9PEZI|nr:ankyrin repeat-containing domain protein [Truncatella angustata]KAH6659443.1 ankyrin repeat-containing domain protein [Truncatella angustata]KAH8205552.1 hypothetical protein TruAng_000258 [Truncatella angustata]